MINKGDRVRVIRTRSIDQKHTFGVNNEFTVGETDDHKIWNEDLSWWFERNDLMKLSPVETVYRPNHLQLAPTVLNDVPMNITFKVDGVDFDMSLVLAKKVKNILSVLV